MVKTDPRYGKAWFLFPTDPPGSLRESVAGELPGRSRGMTRWLLIDIRT